MRYFILAAVGCLTLSIAGCSGGSAQHTGSVANGTAAGRYIVGLKAGSTASLGGLAVGLANQPEHVYSHAVHGFAGLLTSAEVQRLQADPNVSFVEPDLTVTANRPPGGGGGGSGEQLGWGYNLIGAGQNSGTRGQGVAVAVFDTGIDLTHPDLAAGIIASFDATGGGSALDRNGHGSHCAGIVGARDNEVGYIGVAPNCKLVAVKVLGNNGSGSISNIVAGIDWAVANKNAFAAPIRVGSMSFGAQGSSAALATAITNGTAAGIIFVASAGNSAANAGNYTPASLSNVITVSALDPDNTWASYSNYGSVVDLIAPGTSVPSTWKGGGYNSISGTSMACPHVAGCVALWLDDNYDADPLNDHADDFASVLGALQGVGSTSWTGDPNDGFHEPCVRAASL